jgi:glutamate 5-kinase
MRAEVSNAKILVVKVGSSLLIDGNQLNRKWLAALAADLAQARANGQQIIVVSSGAVALGCAALGLSRDTLTLEQSQAAAAAGQIDLAHGWKEVLQPLGLSAAQILLTLEDTEQRRRYLNGRRTLQSLLDLGAIPIINENDTVATQELRYGDNDRLAARVAGMISADCLILFSDVDGLYTAAPGKDASAELITEIDVVDEAVMAMAGGSNSDYGSGGMITKLEAARIAMQSGCHMVLADGRMQHPLVALSQGAASTLFKSQAARQLAH